MATAHTLAVPKTPAPASSHGGQGRCHPVASTQLRQTAAHTVPRLLAWSTRPDAHAAARRGALPATSSPNEQPGWFTSSAQPGPNHPGAHKRVAVVLSGPAARRQHAPAPLGFGALERRTLAQPLAGMHIGESFPWLVCAALPTPPARGHLDTKLSGPITDEGRVRVHILSVPRPYPRPDPTALLLGTNSAATPKQPNPQVAAPLTDPLRPSYQHRFAHPFGRRKGFPS